MKTIARLSIFVAPFFLRCVAAAEAAAPVRFADPNVANSLPSSSTTGIGQVTFSLLLVLVAVFVVALLVKRLRAVTGAGTSGIEVLAQTSLGAKERAVVVRVGSERLLLGVASGQVSLLHKLPPDAMLPTAPAVAGASQRSNFTEMLKKSLGR